VILHLSAFGISKATAMDSHYWPAWIGFGHAFSADSEHDQALTAYSTAAKLNKGCVMFIGSSLPFALPAKLQALVRSHLPMLFMGMQHLTACSPRLAEAYLEASLQICPSDPLISNEMGIMWYQREKYVLSTPCELHNRNSRNSPYHLHPLLALQRQSGGLKRRFSSPKKQSAATTFGKQRG
jgi:hypothetical protein